jgi:hypothetical protein
MMHGHEKSDPAIVATKPANKAARSATEPSVKEHAAAEPVERRAGTNGNADWQSTRRTQSRVSVSQALERILALPAPERDKFLLVYSQTIGVPPKTRPPSFKRSRNKGSSQDITGEPIRHEEVEQRTRKDLVLSIVERP